MDVVRSVEAMRALSERWRREPLRIGFVPTMGYLHDGHLALVDRALELTDRVVVSIYVNPTQFGPNEDLDAYPRAPRRDQALCEARGAAAVFYPDDGVMYRPGHSTWVQETSLSVALCGRSRPTHFRGVTTVVTKLFNIVAPHVAVFGRKDAQQALIIQRMVRDLNQPVEIVVCPIVREADGLAMSSRNRYLTADERCRALAIHRGLTAAQARFESGCRDVTELTDGVRRTIEAAGGRVDYVDCVGRADLAPMASVNAPALLAVAAYFGNTRLIDNCYLG